MSSPDVGPKPKTITGGCLCGALRYTITFPESHDFASDAQTCQCTQCRKQSGALFVAFHRAPRPFQWSAAAGTRTLKEFSITPVAKRGFSTECSSWLYYRAEEEPWASLCVGTVDQEVLIGAPGGGGSGGGEGFGRALVNGLGVHEWCENEIPGVTDDIPLLRKGVRNQTSGGGSTIAKAKL